MTSARGSRHVYRRGGVRWLLLFTMWWLVALSTFGGAHAGMSRSILGLMALAQVAILLVAILEYRSAVIVEAGGFTIRTPFRTRRFGWDDVAGIEIGRQGLVAGPAATLRLRDGRCIPTPLWSGGLGVGNRSAERRIRSLCLDVEGHRRASPDRT